MKHYPLKIVVLLVCMTFLASACAPQVADRVPAVVSDQPGGSASLEVQAGQSYQPLERANGQQNIPGAGLELQGSPERNTDAGIEPPPMQSPLVCPTPIPIDLDGVIGQGETVESDTAQAGPATPDETISGDSIPGVPSPEELSDLIDQVNQSPSKPRNDGESTGSSVAPDPGTESQLGDQPGGSSLPAGSGSGAKWGFWSLVSAFLDQVIGTATTPPSGYEPWPSLTPCPYVYGLYLRAG